MDFSVQVSNFILQPTFSFSSAFFLEYEKDEMVLEQIYTVIL